ncbi:MAG: glycosyltransferase family 4 protein [Deinococcales bacterium]|nr:glycosyltransferase family 4 protein [Deinococcales bacterium]
MHVVYLHQYYRTPSDNTVGGTRSYEFARRLVANGHTVDLITSDNRPEASWRRGWRVTDDDGVRVHWLPVPYDNDMSYARRLRSFAAFALGSARKAAELGGDVVFATSTPLTICLPAVYAAWRTRAPMVFEVRDLWPDAPIAMGVLRHPLAIGAARWLERFAYRNAAQVIALSRGMADGVVRAGVPAEHVHVIPNGCDLDLFGPDPAAAAAVRSELAWLGDRPLVVYVGTFGAVNGVGYLVEVAARVAELDPEVRFLLMGEGREFEAVRSRAAQLGLLDRSVFVMGPKPKTEVAKVLAAADLATSVVVDVPALWNNSANKFFDGLASGTAFAVNHEGWQADLLREWQAGLVLDARDTAAAAADIVTALRTPGWAETAGSNARRLAEAEFARDALAARFEEVLVQSGARYAGKNPLPSS